MHIMFVSKLSDIDSNLSTYNNDCKVNIIQSFIMYMTQHKGEVHDLYLGAKGSISVAC